MQACQGERERVIGIGSEGCQERGCQGEGM